MSNVTGDGSQALIDGLRTECEVLQRFGTLLEHEQDCLVRDDVEGLARLTAMKYSLAQDVARLEVARVRSWSEAASGEAQSLWSTLRERASGAKRLNESNGKLIALRLQHVRGALWALRAVPRAHTYGPDGQPGEAGLSRRVLGSA